MDFDKLQKENDARKAIMELKNKLHHTERGQAQVTEQRDIPGIGVAPVIIGQPDLWPVQGGSGAVSVGDTIAANWDMDFNNALDIELPMFLSEDILPPSTARTNYDLVLSLKRVSAEVKLDYKVVEPDESDNNVEGSGLDYDMMDGMHVVYYSTSPNDGSGSGLDADLLDDNNRGKNDKS